MQPIMQIAFWFFMMRALCNGHSEKSSQKQKNAAQGDVLYLMVLKGCS